MGHFSGKLVVKYLDGISWEVLQIDPSTPFQFTTDEKEVIVVPNGFLTDMASVRGAISWLIPRTGNGGHLIYGPSCVLHDALYVGGKIDGEWITRKRADQIFIQCNKAMDVSPVITWMMYSAIRIFGGPIWARHKDGRPSENNN
jgi:hypothetical protein